MSKDDIQYGSASHIKFDLGSKLEFSAILLEVRAVNADSGCGNVFEEDTRVLVGSSEIKFGANSKLSSVVSLGIVVLNDQKCLLEWSFTIDVENALSTKRVTSSPN